MAILEFKGEHRWLSNFWPAEVWLDGAAYPCVENAYQAAKIHPAQREPLRHCTPGQAKRLGGAAVLRASWERDRVWVMYTLLEQKFAPGTELGARLVATGDELLVEGNQWGDVFWGVCRGQGENCLGRLLMKRRAFLHAIAMA